MFFKLKKTTLIDWLAFLYCLSLSLYVFLRADQVSFTFDEVTTIQIATGKDWSNFTFTTNNQILNTLLIKASLYLFNPSELVYRLPNVLAFVLYLIYSYKLGKLLKPNALIVPLILLTAIPFVLDFFSLARGYGLALSFFLPSTYFLIRYVAENKFKLAIFSLIFGMLAVLSNFILFNYFLSLLFVLFLFLLTSRQNILARLLPIVLIAGTFLFFIFPILFQLKNNGQLYLVVEQIFFYDTILSLSRCFAYKQLNTLIVDVFFVSSFLIALLFSIFTLVKFIKKKTFDVKVILPILFLLSVLMPIVQHLLLDTSYPVERTALFYFPLLILVLVNGLSDSLQIIQSLKLKIMACLFIVQLVLTLNLKYCYSWQFDSGSKEAISYILENQGDSNNVTTLGIDYLYTPSTWFYIGKSNIKTTQVVDCWEYNMNLEELNPEYFGVSEIGKSKLTHSDADKILAADLDYYFLNTFVVNELIRLEYDIEIEKKFDYAGAYLFTYNRAQH